MQNDLSNLYEIDLRISGREREALDQIVQLLTEITDDRLN
jgi:hypothetical protein